MLYVSAAAAILVALSGTAALQVAPAVPPTGAARARGMAVSMSVSDDLGIPCEGDCDLTTYPKMPATVHPGVVTGKAMIDLLNHAKAEGYAIPAVNCVTSSSVNACLEAARSA